MTAIKLTYDSLPFRVDIFDIEINNIDYKIVKDILKTAITLTTITLVAVSSK